MSKVTKYAQCAFFASALCISGSVGAQVVEIIEVDDFDDYSLTDDYIGGWFQQMIFWNDSACTSYKSVDPSNPKAAENRNYFTVANGAGGSPDSTGKWGYYDQMGLSDKPISGAISLNLYPNDYHANPASEYGVPCHYVRAFKTVTTTSLATRDITPESGNYKINAKVMIDPSRSDRELKNGHTVGVFLLITNNEVTPAADNGWGIMFNTYREVPLAGDVLTVAEDFAVDLGDVEDVTISAGLYNQTVPAVYDGSFWDDFSLTFGGLTEEEKAAAAAEKAACEDTSTIRFEEEFGDVDATCLTDTYSFPADAQDWGGYADKIKDESIYPFGHFYGGGSISFDCEKVGTGSQRIRFKFEVEGFPGNTSGPTTDWATCTAPATTGLGRLSEVVATQDAGSITLQIPPSPRGESYNNLIMYLETKGGPSVKVTNVSVNAVRRSDPNSGAATGQPSPGIPIPVLPFWALLALVTATGLIAVRLRQ